MFFCRQQLRCSTWLGCPVFRFFSLDQKIGHKGVVFRIVRLLVQQGTTLLFRCFYIAVLLVEPGQLVAHQARIRLEGQGLAVGFGCALGLAGHYIGVAQAAVEGGPLGLQWDEIGVDGDGLLVKSVAQIGIAQEKVHRCGLRVKAQKLLVEIYGIGVLPLCGVQIGQAQ